MTKRKESSNEEIIELKLKKLDFYTSKRILEWAEHNNKLKPRVKVLTKTNISYLPILIEKHYARESETPAERKAKQEIHQSLKNAFFDIYQMVRWELIGDDSPYKIKKLNEDFPLYMVGEFIQRLVELNGDDYATHLVSYIQKGLDKYQTDKSIYTDVQIIKRAR